MNTRHLILASAAALLAVACGDASTADATEATNRSSAEGDLMGQAKRATRAEQTGFPGISTDASPEKAQAELPEGYVAVMDVNGFGKPMPAYAFARPKGFIIESATIEWSELPCLGMGAKSRLLLRSPDGQVIESGGERAWINGLDQTRAMMAQQSGTLPPMFNTCTEGPKADVETFLRQLIASERPSAEIVSIKRRPDLSKKAVAEARARDAFMPQGQKVTQLQFDFQTAEATIRYREGGKDIEEVLVTNLISFPITGTPMTLYGTSGLTYLTGPAGSLDKKGFDTLLTSLRPLDAYVQREARKSVELSSLRDSQQADWKRQADARAARARQARASAGSSGSGSSYLATSRAVLGNSMDSYNRRQAAQDKVSAGFSDAISGTTTVYDPHKGHDISVQGSGIDVWQDSIGNITTTDQSSGFDPSSTGADLTKLDPISGI